MSFNNKFSSVILELCQHTKIDQKGKKCHFYISVYLTPHGFLWEVKEYSNL